MSRFYSYINSAKTILSAYTGETPLHVFLKGFFATDKKYGSRDRKSISSICYNYFRLGYALTDKSIEDRLLTSFFLTSAVGNDWLQAERPDWDTAVQWPLQEKVRLAGVDLEKIFPFAAELSEGIDRIAFNLSFLIQPDVFLRVRPGKQVVVRKKLGDANIAFNAISEDCLAVANGTALEKVLEINREAVIQDMNSQNLAMFFPPAEPKKTIRVWDCCAASGGKSIMAYDSISPLELTVTDLRESIIHNLRNRFKLAGIKSYHSFVADLTDPQSLRAKLKNATFDLVLCDAPCSGSGTWSRTPEQLSFFEEEEIKRYSSLQKKIAASAIPFVKNNGHLLYITCSVFKKENEEVVEFIQAKFGLKLVRMELLKGYDFKADSMFAALFKVSANEEG